MTRFLETKVAEIILLCIITIVILSSCSSSYQVSNCPGLVTNDTYDESGYLVDCENCDEID